MRSKESIMQEIAEKRDALARLKSGHGFRLGNGPASQAEARRRRREINDLQLLVDTYDDDARSEA